MSSYVLYKFIIIFSENTYKKLIFINFSSVKYESTDHFRDRLHSREKGGVDQNFKKGGLSLERGGTLRRGGGPDPLTSYGNGRSIISVHLYQTSKCRATLNTTKITLQLSE